MPKKRKTRQQKMLTNQKKQVVQKDELLVEQLASKDSGQTPTQNITFSLSSTENRKKEKTSIAPQRGSIAITTHEYDYLKNDLLKTAILTSAIVIAELVIRFMVFRG